MNKSSQEFRPARHISIKENMTPIHRQSRSGQRRTNQALSSRSNLHSPHQTQRAAVFSRKNSLSTVGFVCHNHKTKQAKYRIISEDQDTLYYCEKCSIYLASQGFPVEKLQQQQHFTTPSEVVEPQPVCNTDIPNELQSHIDHVLRNLQEKEQVIRRKILDAEQFKQQIEQNLDAYFKKIIEFIHEKKKEFKKFVDNEHRKLLQDYQSNEVQIQKAIIETYDIKDQISDRLLDASEKSYYKNCIMKSRIMCEKLDVLKSQNKKDIVTIDLSEIIRIIDQNLKIKVKVTDMLANDESEYEYEQHQQQNDCDELGQMFNLRDTELGRSITKKSMCESEIRRLSEHYNNLFSGEVNQM